MKIACIIFPSGDLTTLAREAEVYRAAFRSLGHVFDILASTKDSGVTFHKFPTPDYIDGRYDSRLLVDGVVSHHPDRAKAAGMAINTAYDAVLFIGLCPYSTRAYGSEPHWLELYRAIKRPKIGKVVDIMPGTGWPELAYEELGSVWFSQACFIPEDSPTYDKHRGRDSVLPTPFIPPTVAGVPYSINKTERRSVIWSGGWNRVDGIVEFLHEIPKIGEHSKVTLTGIGSQYFRQRKKGHWHQAVRHDSHADFDGIGPADSIGSGVMPGRTPLMGESWAAVDLVGLDRGDLHHGYSEGVYTPSMIEALWMGTWPVVATQCEAHSPIPSHFLRRGVVNQEDISDTLKIINGPLYRTSVHDEAKEWVMDTHDAVKGAETLIKDVEGMI